MYTFAICTLGKNYTEEISQIEDLPSGLQRILTRIRIKCTKVPAEFVRGTNVFIWIDSDHKGASAVKAGLKAIARLTHINRGSDINDESTVELEISYIFAGAIDRVDILREAPAMYYMCSGLPVIGLNNDTKATIQVFSNDGERCDLSALFEIIKTFAPGFENDALRLNPEWQQFIACTTQNRIEDKDCSHLIETGNIVAEDSILNQFAKECFMYFYKLDNFAAFWPHTIVATIKNGATFRTIKDNDNGIVFTGLFKADNIDEGQYFSNSYRVDDRLWYLPSNWSKTEYAPGTKARNALSIQCLERFVSRFYPDYEIVSTSYSYTLFKTRLSSSFKTTNLNEFWLKVGRIVLKTDQDFSKLPRYYHKGHIRVKSNYGGATNFSIGYYDPASGRVDTDNSFEYTGQAEVDEHTFYLSTEIANTKAFDYFIPVFNKAYSGLFEIEHDGNEYRFFDKRDLKPEIYNRDEPRQIIFFGAPGTGKSHAVNKVINEIAPKRSIRTTFHPDTDYSSFVGCFKPTMQDGRIEYAFTAQAFVKAYIEAWRDRSKPYFLVIEEINRGNCAQIFGDIFQLLDRDIDGQSCYTIKPDTDLQAYIAENLNLTPNIPENIASGEDMCLPGNLFIYATMNTSDQSLFPIDSAFKRRWEMRYTAIKPGEHLHTIAVGKEIYSWTSFINKVNKKILELTKSEDKQLGYWFIKPNTNHEICWKQLVSKAIFYLWNDVIKDYAGIEKEDSAFGKKFAFSTFFDSVGEPVLEHVIDYLDTLGVEKIVTDIDAPENEDSDDEIDDNDTQSPRSKDTTKYSINGTGQYNKRSLAAELVTQYIADHPNMSAAEVVEEWRTLGNIVSHFIELQEEFKSRKDQKPRVKIVKCNGENIYVSTNGWGGVDKMKELIQAVESKDWGLSISEYPK